MSTVIGYRRVCLPLVVMAAAGCLGQSCSPSGGMTSDPPLVQEDDTLVLGYEPDPPPDTTQVSASPVTPPAIPVPSSPVTVDPTPVPAPEENPPATEPEPTPPDEEPIEEPDVDPDPPPPLPPAPITQSPSSRGHRAFPRAEGFGALSQGGRGGRVLAVTHLRDYNPALKETPIVGSFRWAVEQNTGPRIVVFRVGGTILLKSQVRIEGEAGSYLTIAGQTAPGDGIQLSGFGINLYRGAHDIVIRHLRIRPCVAPTQVWVDPDGTGPLPSYMRDWDNDALTIYGPGSPVSNVIIDHCSLGRAFDENVGVSATVERITLQHCILSEGSTFGHYGHPEEYPYSHSCGMLVASEEATPSDQYLTLHHNLFIHNTARNPMIVCNDSVVEFINNVIHNTGGYALYVARDLTNMAHGSPKLTVIGNHYTYGPDDAARGRRMVALEMRNSQGVQVLNSGSIHVSGNIDPHRLNETMGELEAVFDSTRTTRTSEVLAALSAVCRASPWPSGPVPVTIESAKEAYARVQAEAGATRPRRDVLDQRLIQDLAAGIGRVGFGPQLAYERNPVLLSGNPPADSDGDGMPDGWELAQGLKPLDPSDGSLDPDQDGYTNLEEYLNELAGDE